MVTAGEGSVVKSGVELGEDVGALSKAAAELDPTDKGGLLTRAGRALQKHGNRIGSVFPKVNGNPESINAQGQQIVNKILNDPKSQFIQLQNGGLDIVNSKYGGIRYNSDGSFFGFREL